MKSTKNISQFLFEQFQLYPSATGHFTLLMERIVMATKQIEYLLSTAGLCNLLGKTGQMNLHGDEVKKLDILANETFHNCLSDCPFVAALASEEDSEIRVLSDSNEADYVVAFDPVDGSDNIDVNGGLGTIFSIRKRDVKKCVTNDVFLTQGTHQVAAGYVIYGHTTIFVLTTGNGVF